MAVHTLDDRIIPEPNTGCHLWLGRVNDDGYGRVVRKGRTLLVHRLIFSENIGPIPAGLSVLHKCDNPACCNLEHLYLGTQGDNVADRKRRGRNADKRGINNPRAVLTDQQIKDIRHASGSLSNIGSRYGIGKDHVSKIKLRKICAHVI